MNNPNHYCCSCAKETVYTHFNYFAMWATSHVRTHNDPQVPTFCNHECMLKWVSMKLNKHIVEVKADYKAYDARREESPK